jgi:DNA ligase (NAD+)
VEHFPTIEKLTNTSVEELEEVPDIGPVVAQSVYEFLHEPSNQRLISELKELGLRFEYKPKKRSVGTFTDKTLVITGEFDSFSQDEVKKLIQEHGGKVTESVSSKTDYLVVGTAPGSKLAKAEKLGIRRISEKELKNLLGIS